MAKILFLITEDWYFYSHRLPLARAALAQGHEVVLLTNVNEHGDLIRSEGIRVLPLTMKRRSMNPITELRTLRRILAIYRCERPDLVHHVALKPVLYGSFVAACAGFSTVVNALAGMGFLFISERFSARVLRFWVKLVLRFLLNRGSSRLILQNPDDAEMLVQHGVADENKITIIKGAGVDVSVFVPGDEAPAPVTVILPARMLIDKGVCEFVEAARLLAGEGCNARFVLVGGIDIENPASLSEEQLIQWQNEQNVEWWGHRSDMTEVLAQSHVVCLPSYREGLPKALLEAAACGKPIVATDVPGCREIVVNEVNGLLVPARDSQALACALRRLVVDKGLRERMGTHGREMVVKEFSERKVVDATIRLYNELLFA